MSTDDFKMTVLVQLILAAGFCVCSHAVYADPDTDTDQSHSHEGLDPVLVTAQALKGPPLAPSQGSLVATQPQSIVGRDFIQLNDAPAANYTDIIKLTPSVWAVDPNGPGLMENQGVSIRGFQDGQFNVTFDGIPWGDANDFTHHTTSYFMAHDIGQAIIDRGPGTASTIGNATFGGTVSILSKDPSSTFQAGPYATLGSWGTTLFGGEVDTGAIAAANGATGFIDAEGLHTDGYLDN